MSAPVGRVERRETERELRRDRRAELWLLLQAAIAIGVVLGIVWVRETWFA